MGEITSKQPTCRIEELGHTADIGLRIRADSPRALFACAGQAMFDLAGAKTDNAGPSNQRSVVVTSIDVESLLVDWLSELLYLHETTGEVYTDCLVTSWSPTRLEATVEGGPPAQPPILHIKAVTYHQLRVVEEEGGWLAQVYFDI